MIRFDGIGHVVRRAAASMPRMSAVGSVIVSCVSSRRSTPGHGVVSASSGLGPPSFELLIRVLSA